MEFFHVATRGNTATVADVDILPRAIKYVEICNDLARATNADIKYVFDKYEKIRNTYLWTILGFDFDDAYIIETNHITSVKHRNVAYNIPESVRARTKPTPLAKIQSVIASLPDILDPSGSFCMYIDDIRVAAEIYGWLSLIFRRCVIYNSVYVVCSQMDTDAAGAGAGTGAFHPGASRLNAVDLRAYLQTNIAYHIRKFSLLLANRETEFLDMAMTEIAESVKTVIPVSAVPEFFVSFNEMLIDNLKRVMIQGKLVKTSSAIHGVEGRFIADIIQKHHAVNCLEVGMAYGISAFYILKNENTRLVSIDPFQSTQWENHGMQFMQEMGFAPRHRLYERKSYEALPKIIEETGFNMFDFIFIDGFHTFDYTLVDAFYATLLLKIKGILVIDDALHPGVKKCVKYIDTNYNGFRRLPSPSTIAVYQKIREDTRDWNFHVNF